MDPRQNDYEFFKSLFEFSDDRMWAVDKDYNLIFCNRIFRNDVECVTGQQVEIGQNVLENPAYEIVREEWKNNYDRVFSKGLSFRMEAKPIILPSDKIIEYCFNPVKNQDGTITAVTVIGRDVTEREESARALSADIEENLQIQRFLVNEKEFAHSLVASMKDGFSLVDHQGVHLYVNPAFLKMTGFSNDELIGHGPPHPYWPPESAEKIETYFKKTLMGHFECFELTFMKKNGERFPVILNPSAVQSIDGKANNYFSTITDISAIVETQNKLKESEANARAIMEASSSMLVLLDRHGVVLDTNSAHAARYDLTRESLCGKCLWDLIPADLANQRSRNVLRVFETGVPVSGEDCRNGRWAKFNIFPVFGNDGNVSKAVIFAEDTTEKKKTTDDLIESEQRARALLDAIPDMMFRLDHEGTYLDFKAPKSELLYQEDTIVGKRNRDLTPPAFADLIEQKIKNTLESGTMEIFEYELPVPDIGLRTFEARMAPSGPDEVIAISRDITDWKKNQQDLLEKNTQLIASNAEKDKFFSILAHDLRSPFNAFLGFTQLMAEELPSMTLDEIQQIAVSMRKSATNLYRLLDNLLEWSRLQRNITSFNPEAFVLLALTNEALSSIKEHATKKNIVLTCEIETNLTAFADVHMVETIIRNMASNAVKFTREGGKIIVSACRLNDKGVEMCISDNGIGMNKEFVNNLFKLDSSTTRPGTGGEPSTGLGLIICKEFVEKHGGKIRVESVEGKGTSFFFNLPGLKP